MALCVLVCLLLAARTAMADSRAEAAARAALANAAKDHAAGDDDGGLLRLVRARKACGSKACSATTRGALARDMGALEFLKGEHAKASAAFAEALDIDPNLPWSTSLDSAEAAAEWSAVKNERAALRETPPEGDFEHVPVSEQAVDTPLPIYAELSASGVATVVVKYKAPGDADFKRRSLHRFGGGWGGMIPCADVKRGVLRYFLQAFDDSGTPIANSGDVKHLYFVPIRWAISGDPPHLPGQSPPDTCNGREQPEPEPAEAASGHDNASGAAKRFVRWWIGVATSIDLTTMPTASDVCALSTALTPVQSGFYCTNPDGSDFPVRSSTAGLTNTPLPGKSGQSSGGPTSGDIRVVFTLDYAVTTHFLTGARIGYVAESYPGAAAARDGHGISSPIHLELRETYLFGDEPLAHSGFAPYAFVSAGYGKFDTSQISSTEVQGVQGPRPVLIWKMGGPFFVAAGGGARYAFSPRIAFLAGVKATLPFGAAGVLPSLAPEVELHYGF